MVQNLGDLDHFWGFYGHFSLIFWLFSLIYKYGENQFSWPILDSDLPRLTVNSASTVQDNPGCVIYRWKEER